MRSKAATAAAERDPYTGVRCTYLPQISVRLLGLTLGIIPTF